MNNKENRPYLSIVLPVYNEGEGLLKVIKELSTVCDQLKKEYEIIFVNDGSRDKSPEILQNLAETNPKVKVLHFSRNFGHQAALSAGIDVALGELVMTMDSDLQHPPRFIPEFIKLAEEGADIVIGERLSNKQHSFLREAAGRFFYKFFSFVTGLDFKNVSDFVLYKRSVISVLKRFPEKERFLRGIVQWIGFKKKYISYIVDKRIFGEPKYSTKRLLGFVLNGVTSFSAFPLRLAFWTGFIIFIFSFIFSGYIMWDHYTNINPFNIGNATIIILVLFLSSIQLMLLGVIGEYLYKMFNEVKGRPLYIVSTSNNVDTDNLSETPYGIHRNK